MFSSEIAMGRRPIVIGKISQKVPPQEVRFRRFRLSEGEGGITPSSSLRSRQRLSALQPAICSSSILCQPATMLA